MIVFVVFTKEEKDMRAIFLFHKNEIHKQAMENKRAGK